MGNNFVPVHSDDIAYLFSDEGLTFESLFNKEKYIVNFSIADLSKQMNFILIVSSVY